MTVSYQVESVEVSVLLSRHNSERDEEHNALWAELREKITSLASDPRYAAIQPELDACWGTRPPLPPALGGQATGVSSIVTPAS